MRTLIVALLGAGIVMGAAEPADADEATVLAPPPGARLLLRAQAEGVQVYTCAAQAAGPAWVLKGPEAVLRDASNREIGKHFAGPSWQALDGSTVVGEVAARADAPSGGAVPWLLLRAKAHSGAGQFAGVAFIQRIDTKGGIPPATGCETGKEGSERRVPYSAAYLFYAAR